MQLPITRRSILRKAILIVSTCLAVQLGVNSAYAAEDSASVVDEIFESTFEEDDAQPEGPAPGTEAPLVSETAGQGLAAPPASAPPASAPPALAPNKDKSATSGTSTVGTPGDAKAGTPGKSAAADDEDRSGLEDQGPSRAATANTQGTRRVSSTAYCLTGMMASGRRVYSGAVAMNGTPMGSRYQVLDGPRAGETFTVADRIGYGSSFDIAYPGDCRGASNYGRRTITIRPV